MSSAGREIGIAAPIVWFAATVFCTVFGVFIDQRDRKHAEVKRVKYQRHLDRNLELHRQWCRSFRQDELGLSYCTSSEVEAALSSISSISSSSPWARERGILKIVIEYTSLTPKSQLWVDDHERLFLVLGDRSLHKIPWLSGTLISSEWIKEWERSSPLLCCGEKPDNFILIPRSESPIAPSLHYRFPVIIDDDPLLRNDRNERNDITDSNISDLSDDNNNPTNNNQSSRPSKTCRGNSHGLKRQCYDCCVELDEKEAVSFVDLLYLADNQYIGSPRVTDTVTMRLRQEVVPAIKRLLNHLPRRIRQHRFLFGIPDEWLSLT